VAKVLVESLRPIVVRSAVAVPPGQYLDEKKRFLGVGVMALFHNVAPSAKPRDPGRCTRSGDK
jgi:hypothetical protein